jgi:hypothetical protein
MPDDNSQQAYQVGPAAYRTGPAANGPQSGGNWTSNLKRQGQSAADPTMEVKPKVSPSYDQMDFGATNAIFGSGYSPRSERDL